MRHPVKAFVAAALVTPALVAAASLTTAAPAVADVVIRADAGGRIGDYLDMFESVRQSGRRVMIDGPCMSACTLVVSVVPRSRICVTRRAVLGFHAAWRPDTAGRPRRHPEATQLMMDTYPPAIRRWIRRRGGLTARTLLLQGPALAALYPRCESVTAQRRTRPRR